MLYQKNVKVWEFSQSYWTTLLLLGRGLFGTLGISLIFIALKGLSLADASTLRFSSPVFTTLLSALVLSERCSKRDLLSIFISICGVVLISRPSFIFHHKSSPLPPLFVLAALGSALCTSCAYCTMRLLKGVPVPRVVFSLGVISTGMFEHVNSSS